MGKLGWGLIKGVGKLFKGAHKATSVGANVVDGVGRVGFGAVKTTGKAARTAGKFVSDKANLHLTKDLIGEELENATLYQRMLGNKKLTGLGVAALTATTMGFSTVNEVFSNGGRKFAKLGDTSVGDNLDRLVSYDGSGFTKRINEISGGNPEVMQDIVKNTFNKENQTGVSGDIVFALHNMREG